MTPQRPTPNQRSTRPKPPEWRAEVIALHQRGLSMPAIRDRMAAAGRPVALGSICNWIGAARSLPSAAAPAPAPRPVAPVAVAPVAPAPSAAPTCPWCADLDAVRDEVPPVVPTTPASDLAAARARLAHVLVAEPDLGAARREAGSIAGVVVDAPGCAALARVLLDALADPVELAAAVSLVAGAPVAGSAEAAVEVLEAAAATLRTRTRTRASAR